MYRYSCIQLICERYNASHIRHKWLSRNLTSKAIHVVHKIKMYPYFMHSTDMGEVNLQSCSPASCSMEICKRFKWRSTSLDVMIIQECYFCARSSIKGRDKKLNATDTVGCNYLSLSLIPASGSTLLCFIVDSYWRQTLPLFFRITSPISIHHVTVFITSNWFNLIVQTDCSINVNGSGPNKRHLHVNLLVCLYFYVG